MIRALPKNVVERIAAGEVIERPGSVVKELVENALDAGATRVDVRVDKGGREQIEVADDGAGITRGDLPLAFAAHATSKLEDVDDLLHIASFGFRGEALATIGAVSRARIVSRARGCVDGYAIGCEGGVVGDAEPAASPFGTRVTVRQLFFNTPARLKFLKSDPAEAARCLDHVIAAAIPADGVAFTCALDGRSVLNVPAAATRRERIAAAYGDTLARELIEVHRTLDGLHVDAFLAPPRLAKARSVHQDAFLNGRPITDAGVRAVVKQAYREFLAPQLQPAWFVFLGLDPADVDVNVHPAKREVRFRESQRVLRALHHVVLDALRGADLSARTDGAGAWTPSLPSRPFVAPPRAEASPRTETIVRTFGTAEAPTPASERSPPGECVREVAPLFPEDRPAVPAVPEIAPGRFVRAFDTYIVAPSGEDLVLIDQHALHERVLFEELRRDVLAGAVKRQRLLLPQMVEVGRSRMARFDEVAASADRLGLELTAFSPSTVAVHALPALLARARVGDLVEAVFDESRPLDAALHRDQRELEERLHTLACRGAVKAGDVLHDDEVMALLDAASRLPEAKACPHGRPTSVKIPRGDLDRWFKRTGF
ncbi:MAG: DNA mismatch repair endonuclease MutL, partial [Planctomycetes bacterium]|nr:DNA mismatch repair endonuclease MutL [Planctomycetota bacterium]